MGTPDVRPKTCVPSQEAREVQFSPAPLTLAVLVRLRLRRFFVELFDELTRRAAREGPESVQRDGRAGADVPVRTYSMAGTVGIPPPTGAPRRA